MPASGRLTFSGEIENFPSGSRTFESTIELTNSVDQSSSVLLTSGYNQISVPTGASGCIIQPPFNNVVPITLKGATGDTGILLHPTNPHIQSLGVGALVLGITAASSLSGTTEFNFF